MLIKPGKCSYCGQQPEGHRKVASELRIDTLIPVVKEVISIDNESR